ncbi:MAG: pitrilysin family protein [Proteiniphilum sp.]|jgi:predicted Zn-dependent peptidase|nr:pitrilysin family protein [Proteiniphilum sp.]NCD13939.1 insulinase family protein [Bacteroidia bacterium]HHT35295.1 insulinase family protein [Bacteroidales bacterium]MDD3556518.1 pitrilysin family protein [Proteiniphilum sp.]MDD3979147.1 pitrilysin family protein [Proteiniphilum sp.]
MIYTHTLSNGLRIIHRNTPSEISHCGIAVNTGSRDEYPQEAGMAHFVEHMLFKGTQRRRAHHIAGRMESVGGELNAYTTKEETFYYATFLGEYFPRAVELLADMLFHSEFSPLLIDREREVILDEINSYQDDPAELIWDDFENMLFAGHDLGHYILGVPETLQRFDREQILHFMEREYQPSRMVFFSSGRIPFPKVVKQLERYFSIAPAREEINTRIAPTFPCKPRKEMLHKNTSQSHVMMGVPALSMRHPQRHALLLLNNILGGGSLNSRLNASLREKHGLVYHVESNVTLYSDTGLFAVYFAGDPQQRERCIRLVKKEINRLLEKELTPLQLNLAKRQWKGQLGIAAEQNENYTLAMAKRFLHTGRYLSLKEMFDRIDAITAEELHDTARYLFDTDFFDLTYQ